MQDFIADVVRTRLILPEGASDVRLRPGALPLTEEDGRTFSYLDTAVGRPTKTVTAVKVTRAALTAPVEVRRR